MTCRLAQVFDNKENIDPNPHKSILIKNSENENSQKTFGLLQNPKNSQDQSYSQEINSYLFSIEHLTMPQFGYMKKQIDINEKMRAILIDWIAEVHHKFDLIPETFFLTVNLIDRYLEKQNVLRNSLQLIGVSALFLACKYEEISRPVARDLVLATDKAYSKAEIIETERKILIALDYQITFPSSLRFLEGYIRNLSYNEQAYYLSKYILELSLVDYKTIKFNPSLLAASSLYLANKLLKIEFELLSEENFDYCQYSKENLNNCAKELCVLLQNAKRSTLQSIYKKFALPKFRSVSLLL